MATGVCCHYNGMNSPLEVRIEEVLPGHGERVLVEIRAQRVRGALANKREVATTRPTTI